MSDIFTRNAFELSDSKEISFGHLKAYMAVVESTRLYFSSLGTKLAATRDIGKLMQQRTDLMREMAVLKAEIELLSNSIQDEAQDTASFLFERGGYLKYLQMSEPGSLLSSQEPDLTVYNGWIAPADVSIPSEDQVQRRNRRNKSHRKENNSDDDNMELEVRVSDATVYENGCVLLYDDGSSSTGDDDSFIESAIKKKWAALRNRRLPLGGELHLDIDLLEDLLEGAGLSISDHDAQRCLAQVPRNQANMYTCQDILKWVKTYSREKRVVHPIWTRNFCRMSGLFEAWQRCLKGIVEAIGCQTRLLRDSPSSAYYHQFIARLPATDPISLTCSCLSLSAFINVDQTGAHRQQKLAPPAIKKAFNSNTPPRANASVKEPVVSESAAKEEEEHANRRGTQSQIHISYESTSERTKSSSRSQSQIRLADANRRLVRSIKEVSAGDVLEYFNHKKKEDADCDGVPTYKTAIWLTLQAQKPSVSDYEMQVLLQTSVHFFKGIPYDYRHDFYSYVHGDIFTALPEDVLQSGGNTNSQKVVIIALLGVEDIFENMEKRFPNEVLFTRMIRSLEFTIACQSTLQELYQASSAYSACRSRLFGPQEDELGEEGMNPLVFARQCRLQKKAIEEQLSSLRGWDLDTLKSHLSSHGYSSSGTIGEIKDRAQVVLTRQMERVGSGEISLFGRRICTRVFHKYDADGDGELSVHEINCLLSDLEVGTLYDLQEYKLISAKFGLLTGEKGGLTLPAFVACKFT